MGRKSLDSLRDTLFRILNPEKLDKEIELAEFNEILVLVRRTRNYKLGIVVKKNSNDHLCYTLELLLSVLHDISEVDVEHLEKASKMTHKLVLRDYSLHHQGDGWILCEKTLAHSQILSECSFLIEELE
jgi:hypothetical protein